MHAKKSNPLPIIVIALLVVIILLLVLLLVLKPGSGGSGGETVSIQEDGVPRIGYAEGVVVTDPDSMQRKMDEMVARSKEPGISLEYKNNAYSDNGVDFSCYIGNSADNEYDMYIDIYADDALTDEIFLSELLRPGTAFDKLSLKHPLEQGDHTVYVAFTQVEEIDGQQSIHGQVVVTMDFHVSG